MRFLQYRDYPHTKRYLCTRLPVLDLLSPRVWDAFCEVCEDDELARQAISLGTGPMVVIDRLERKVNGEYLGAHGGVRDHVYINIRVAKQYEKKGRWKILESTVLHEMVHWARFVGNKPRDYNGQEAGEAFEKKAYGRNVNCGCYKGYLPFVGTRKLRNLGRRRR